MIRSQRRNVLGSMHGVLWQDMAHRVARVSEMRGDEEEYDRLIETVARLRDREAFARLFQHFAPKLKAYLMKAGAAPAAAEDFAQDAMLTVWRKAGLFDGRRARASTWIFAIARNLRLDALRRDARPLSAPEIELTATDPDRPDDLYEVQEDAERIRDALQSLSAEQIEVVRLAYFHEQAHSEIAQGLKLPLGTVKSRIRAAMSKLRLKLDDAAAEAPR